MGRRTAQWLVLAAGLSLAACGGSETTRNPTAVTGPAAHLTSCISADSIMTLIDAVYPAGNERTSAEGKFNNILALLGPTPPGPDTATAQAHVISLIDFTNRKYEAGQLLGGTSTQTQQALADLMNGLLCISGLPTGIDPSSLGPDGAVEVINPGDGETLVLTGTKWAGVNVPAASVPVSVILTITRLPDSPGPLLTNYDQYPLFYEIHTIPEITFLNPVLIGVCQGTFPFPDYARVQLAHNVPPYTDGSIELLPFQTAPFLDCTGAEVANLGTPQWLRTLARVVGPAPLQATSSLGTCCLGGTASRLSPFGAVDPVGNIGANSPTSQSAPVGSDVLSAPSVKVTTATNVPMEGVKVTFAVAGGGGSVTGAIQFTDVNGIATVGSWTLGPVPGPNSLTATAATVPTGTTLIGNPVTFTATGNPPTQVKFITQPSNTIAGAAITPAPQVGIYDAFNNLVTGSTAPVSMSIGSGPGGASLGGTTTVNAAGGIATFTNLVLVKAGSYTLAAASSGLTGATSNSFTVSSATASSISINDGNNQTALEGTSVAIPPSCVVRDAFGNGVSGVPITFAPLNGGSVTGANQVTGSDGVARVGSWTLVAGLNQLEASAALSLTGNPVLFSATGTTPNSTLMDCAPSNGAGDPVSRAFYIPSFPGKYLKQVDLYLSSNAPANVAAPYVVRLTARLGGYDGPVLGTSDVPVLLNGTTSQNLVTHFAFNNTITVSRNSTIAFTFTVLSNPTGASLFFNTGPCGVGDNKCKSSCKVVETVDASGTLSTFYRNGVAIKVIGGS